MIQKSIAFRITCLISVGFLGGCTNVDVWDRNILAKDHMTVIPDPLGTEFREHVNQSREGTEGATGIQSGGCGCN